MNESRLRVSIVIPAHNEERHLKTCLQAIAAQTSKPYEVIVVDNNSDDKTAGTAATYPFVWVVDEPTQGIVHARNAGFDAAQGDIIARIDADIQLPPNWVEHIQQFYAQKSNWTRAWSGAGYFYNMPLPRFTSWMYGQLAFGMNKILLGHYTLWGSNMAMTSDQWRAVRSKICKRLDVHEDLDLAIHIAEAGYGITYDTLIKTKAELRRIETGRDKLWDYLQWWPNTLRYHGKKTWVICWFFGAFGLYVASFVWLLMGKLSGAFSRQR